MRFFLGIAVLFIILGGSRVDAETTDTTIAREAAARASTLLRKDISSEEGHQFLALARTLDLDSDVVMMVEAFLEHGKAPIAFSPHMGREELLRQIKSQGLILLDSRFRDNVLLGKLSLLYLEFAEHLIPDDIQILKGIAALHSYGIQGDLSDLLEVNVNLDTIYSEHRKPVKITGTKLRSTDVKIAKEAIRVAADLLADDRQSTAGLETLKFARHLLPGEMTGILLSLQVERDYRIEPMKSRFTAEQFSFQLKKRGVSYLEQSDQNEYNAHMGSLFIRLSESFKQKNSIVQSVWGKLRKLKDLFRETPSDPAPKKKPGRKVSIIPRPSIQERSRKEKTVEPVTKFGMPELEAFRSNAREVVTKDKNSLSGGGQERIESVEIRITFENELKRPMEGIQTITCIVVDPYKGSKDDRTVYCTQESPPIAVPSRKSSGPIVVLQTDVRSTTTSHLQTDKSGRTRRIIRYTGHEYVSYFVVIKDKTGQLIQLKARDPRAKEFAMNYAATIEGKSLGLTRNMRFDRYGNRTVPESGE